MKVGSYDWAKHSNTSLSKTEQFGLFGQVVRSQIVEWINLTAHYFKLDLKNLNRVNFDAIRIPDSHFAKATEDYVSSQYSPVLYKH